MGDVALGFSDAIRNSPYSNWAEFQRQKRKDALDERRAALEEESIRHGMKSKDREVGLREREVVSGERTANQNIESSKVADKIAQDNANRAAESHARTLKHIDQQIEELEYRLTQRPHDEKLKEELHGLQMQREQSQIDLNKAQAEKLRADAAANAKPNSADRDNKIVALTSGILNRTARYAPELGNIAKIEAEANARAAAAFAQETLRNEAGDEIPLSYVQRQAAADTAKNAFLKEHEPELKAARVLRGHIEQLVDAGFTPEQLSTISEDDVKSFLGQIGLPITAPSGTKPPPIGKGTPLLRPARGAASTGTYEYPFNQDGSNPLWGSIGNAGVWAGNVGASALGGVPATVAAEIIDAISANTGSKMGARALVDDARKGRDIFFSNSNWMRRWR